MKTKPGQNGQSLFEILFAVAVAAILTTAVATLATTSVRNSSSARDNAVATRYAQQGAEWLRTERDSLGWENFLVNVEDAVSLSSTMPLGNLVWSTDSSAQLQIPGTSFDRHAVFDCYNSADTSVSLGCGDPSVDLVEAEVVVTWTDAGNTRSVSARTQLTSWNL